MTADVIRLIDHGAFACSDRADMVDWLRGWADGLESGDYGDVFSLVVVIETANGNVGCISQSMKELDQTRAVGLLMRAAHEKLAGNGDVEELS